MSWQDAAFDLAWGEFRDWGDPERVVINMTTPYRELSGAPVVEDTREIWELMGRSHYGRVAERPDHDPATCTNPAHNHRRPSGASAACGYPVYVTVMGRRMPKGWSTAA